MICRRVGFQQNIRFGAEVVNAGIKSHFSTASILLKSRVAELDGKSARVCLYAPHALEIRIIKTALYSLA